MPIVMTSQTVVEERGVKKKISNKMVKEKLVENKGDKTIGLVKAEGGKRMRIKFQVADVKKPLLSVKRLVEKGNRVTFSEKGSYIINDKTGDRLELKENGKGSYVMDVDFVGGGKVGSR